MSAIAVGLTVLTGCSIREDSAPRIIADDQVGVFGAVATGDEASGAGSIYLLAPVAPDEQPRLRSVSRDESNPLDVLESLRDGSNAEEETLGLSSAIPVELEITDARTVGTRLTIDINDALNDLTDLPLRLALAQIVATATEIDQVQQVRLRVDGENRSWPTGDGEVTDRPLSIYDYTGFIETSQPPFTALPSGEEV